MLTLFIFGFGSLAACIPTATTSTSEDSSSPGSGLGSSGSGTSSGSEEAGLYTFKDGILTISHTINPFPGESIGLFGLGAGVEDSLQNAAATIVPTGEGDLPVNLGLYGNTSILWTLGTLKDGTTLDDLLWRSSAIADTLADGDTLGLTVWSDVYGESYIFFCTRVTSEGVMPGECALLIEEAGGGVDTGADSGGGGSGGDGDTGDTGASSDSGIDSSGDTSGDTSLDSGTSDTGDTDAGDTGSSSTDTAGGDSSGDTSSSVDTGDTSLDSGTSDTGASSDTGNSDSGDIGGEVAEESFDEGDFGTTEGSLCDTDPFVRSSDGYPLFAYDEDGVCGIYLPGYGSEAEPDASADLTLTGYEIGTTYSVTLEVLNTSTTDAVTFVADFGGEEIEVTTVNAGEFGTVTLTWEATSDEATLRVWTTSTSSWEYDGVLISYVIDVGESDTSSDTGSVDTASVTDTATDTGDSGTDTGSDVVDTGDVDTGDTSASSDTGSGVETGDTAVDTGASSTDTAGGDSSGDASSSDTASSDTGTLEAGDSGLDTSDTGGSSESENIVYESVFVADESEELSSCVTGPFVRNDARPLFAYDEDGVCGVYLPGDGSEIEPLTDAELSLTGYVLGVTYTATVQVYNDSATDSVTFVADFGGQRPETLTLAAGESGEIVLTWEADDDNGTLRVWTTSSSRWSYDGVMTGFVIEY